MTRIVAIAALLAACACTKEETDAIGPAVAGALVEETVEAAANPAVAAAETYARLEGSWAETGQCPDYQVRWEIEPQAFQFHEMRCEIDRIEPFTQGVRAIAQCTVEGDKDDVADAFTFAREPDGSLTIVNEANGAATTGLYPCVESEL